MQRDHAATPAQEGDQLGGLVGVGGIVGRDQQHVLATQAPADLDLEVGHRAQPAQQPTRQRRVAVGAGLVEGGEDADPRQLAHPVKFARGGEPASPGRRAPS